MTHTGSVRFRSNNNCVARRVYSTPGDVEVKVGGHDRCANNRKPARALTIMNGAASDSSKADLQFSSAMVGQEIAARTTGFAIDR